MATIRSTGGWVHNMLGSVHVPPTAMRPREAWAFIEPTRCALQRLLDGVGDRADAGTVGIALNMAYLRCEDGSVDRAWFDQAGLALGAMDEEEPPRPPTAAERETLCAAINRYDEILRTCSKAQWVQTMQDLLVHAGEGRATV